MRHTNRRVKLGRISLALITRAVLVLLFVIYVELLVLTIRVLSGAAAALALFGIIGAGLFALVAMIAVGPAYDRAQTSRSLAVRFLAFTAAQGLLLALSEVLRRFLLGLIAAEAASTMLGFWNHAAMVLGITVAVGGLVTAWVISRRGRSQTLR